MNKLLSLVILSSLILGCSKPQDTTETIGFPDSSSAPEWSKNATIYEVNLRQHTPEGTINAFSEHLSALKALGVDILWLMPIYPISEKFRKADQKTLIEEVDPAERSKYLGSYYAIQDYKAVNPDLGTAEDFKFLVEKAHSMGMKVILDIAANHTGWDHPWVQEHPEYYTKIEKGTAPWNPDWMAAHPAFYDFLIANQMTYPMQDGETDWWDTADLNYDNEDLRREMIDALRFWVEEFNVDGYRCDVAMQVPTDFWEAARKELDSIKPVFMLAEAEQSDHLEYAFDMNYGWELHHIMNKIAASEMTVDNLRTYLAKYESTYQKDDYRMNFITNHDENSWNGTINERMGASQQAMAVLMATLPGMPLLYSGQEAGLNKRLRFFEKDTIEWQESPLRAFYTTLFEQKHKNEALWNGEFGGPLTEIGTNEPEKIFAFERAMGSSRVIIFLNLSEETATFSLNDSPDFSSMHDLFGDITPDQLNAKNLKLDPWQYIFLTSTL